MNLHGTPVSSKKYGIWPGIYILTVLFCTIILYIWPNFWRMIVITGAAGFIGSVLTGKMNLKGRDDLILVDDFSSENKEKNLTGKKNELSVHRDDFFQWFDKNYHLVEFVLHIGARTDTTEFDKDVFDIDRKSVV